MATFLALCQDTARETGVVSGVQPATVESQTGLLRDIVQWVSDSWVWIQNQEPNWRWMRKAWTGSLTASTGTYTAASFSISDFGKWITDNPRRGYQPVSIYLTATGVSDETRLRQISYKDYQALYMTGTQTNGRPVHYAISDANEICFGPIPDDSYTVKGMQRKTAQVLSEDDDVPECPSAFHKSIVWEAARRFAAYDEAERQELRCERERDSVLSDLRRDQLEMATITAGKIA